MVPIVKLKNAIPRPNKREKIIDNLLTRCIKQETTQPFKPSDIIIPNINTIPNTPENTHPANNDAVRENKAAWLKVSKEKANTAPTIIINIGRHSFIFIILEKSKVKIGDEETLLESLITLQSVTKPKINRNTTDVQLPKFFNQVGTDDRITPLPIIKLITVTTKPCPNENKKPTILESTEESRRGLVIASIVAR